MLITAVEHVRELMPDSMTLNSALRCVVTTDKILRASFERWTCAVARVQKRSATDSSSPLQETGILEHVFDYVGPGHWCFVAEVSSI
jgi:hypothetical protein